VVTAVLATVWAFTVPACSGCLVGSKSAGRRCDASGGATLAAAPGLTASKPLYVTFGMSCFDGQGCSPGLSFFVFDAVGSSRPPKMDLLVNLPAAMGDFTVSPPPLSADWNPIGPPGGQLESLTVQSGAIAVHGASEAGFTATFAVELRTSAGEPLSVVDGQATVSNCRIEESCGE